MPHGVMPRAEVSHSEGRRARDPIGEKAIQSYETLFVMAADEQRVYADQVDKM